MKAETVSRFDAADYLPDVETAAAYLEAAIEEAGDDPAVSLRLLAPSRVPATSASCHVEQG